MYKIYNSDKDFMLYRLSEDESTIIDFVLTDDLSRHRTHFNNKFKLVTDIKQQIKNFKVHL